MYLVRDYRVVVWVLDLPELSGFGGDILFEIDGK